MNRGCTEVIILPKLVDLVPPPGTPALARSPFQRLEVGRFVCRSVGLRRRLVARPGGSHETVRRTGSLVPRFLSVEVSLVVVTGSLPVVHLTTCVVTVRVVVVSTCVVVVTARVVMVMVTSPRILTVVLSRTAVVTGVPVIALPRFLPPVVIVSVPPVLMVIMSVVPVPRVLRHEVIAAVIFPLVVIVHKVRVLVS